MLCLLAGARRADSLLYSRTNSQVGVDRACSRIDRFYMPTSMRHRIVEYGILPGVATYDHSPILLNLATTEDGIVYSEHFGKFFRMNVQHLKNEKLAEDIKGIWKQLGEVPNESSYAKFVEAIFRTTRLCRRFGAEQAKKYRCKERRLGPASVPCRQPQKWSSWKRTRRIN